MSVSHFFKRLSYTSCFRFSTLQSPLPLLSVLSFTNCKSIHQWRPNSIFSKITVSSYVSRSYAETPTTESFTTPYLSVCIRCRRDIADMLSEALLCFGASSTSMDQDDSFESSDEVCIDSIFPECQDVGERISQATDSIGLKEVPIYEVRTGDQYDWIKKTQESFYPVEVTEGLWIVPEWRTPPDSQAINIILNPGLAFGTGEHPTTKLCLLLLQGLIKEGELFLDYGTGSGILAIAAVKFGAVLSVGVDIDPQAITSACHNAALNNIGPEKMQLHLVPSKICPTSMDEGAYGAVEEQSSFSTGGLSKTEMYDVVFANILLNPLLELADHIVSYAKPGGVVGISGILSEQVPHIIDRYSQFLERISVSKMDEWACVSGMKKRSLSGS